MQAEACFILEFKLRVRVYRSRIEFISDNDRFQIQTLENPRSCFRCPPPYFTSDELFPSGESMREFLSPPAVDGWNFESIPAHYGKGQSRTPNKLLNLEPSFKSSRSRVVYLRGHRTICGAAAIRHQPLYFLFAIDCGPYHDSFVSLDGSLRDLELASYITGVDI